MKTVSASKYHLVGYKKVFPNKVDQWVFSENVSSKKDPSFMIVSCAKFIKDDQVYFLKEDGSVELHKLALANPTAIYS